MDLGGGRTGARASELSPATSALSRPVLWFSQSEWVRASSWARAFSNSVADCMWLWQTTTCAGTQGGSAGLRATGVPAGRAAGERGFSGSGGTRPVRGPEAPDDLLRAGLDCEEAAVDRAAGLRERVDEELDGWVCRRGKVGSTTVRICGMQVPWRTPLRYVSDSARDAGPSCLGSLPREILTCFQGVVEEALRRLRRHGAASAATPSSPRVTD